MCMSGGSRQHARISSNVHLAIGQQTKGGNCPSYTGDLPIRTPTLRPYRYPDVTIACGNLVFENINGVDVLTNPILVVEVLSPGAESLDRKEKRAAYEAIPSMMELLLIAQDTPHVTQFLRRSESMAGIWARRDYGDLTSAVDLPSIRCLLSLSDVYDGVDFS